MPKKVVKMKKKLTDEEIREFAKVESAWAIHLKYGVSTDRIRNVLSADKKIYSDFVNIDEYQNDVIVEAFEYYKKKRMGTITIPRKYATRGQLAHAGSRRRGYRRY